jgi:hypothetical protein
MRRAHLDKQLLANHVNAKGNLGPHHPDETGKPVEAFKLEKDILLMLKRKIIFTHCCHYF